jgi:hypothetical protein
MLELPCVKIYSILGGHPILCYATLMKDVSSGSFFLVVNSSLVRIRGFVNAYSTLFPSPLLPTRRWVLVYR